MGPTRFFGIGVFLFAIKFALDRTVATLAFGRGWSVRNYLIPTETYTLPALSTALLHTTGKTAVRADIRRAMRRAKGRLEIAACGLARASVRPIR